MGLDIFVYKCKGTNFYDVRDAYKAEERRNKNNLRKVFKRQILKVKNAPMEDLENVMDNFKKKYYSKFPYEHKWNYTELLGNKEELVKFLEKLFKSYYYESTCDFRKVNFLYRYFGMRLDDECCFVYKSDLEDIISKCEKILSEPKRVEELGKELLPTTSGFFFGSTEYDEWYLKDVENVLKQFSMLLADFDETKETLFIEMSW